MHDVGEALRTLAPALAFLLLGVPLAALLERIAFFDALADRLLAGRTHVPILAFWVAAAATTAVLNLDTTIVLLAPLALRVARRTDGDPVVLAVVPLVLASLASSFLPVSNLTTLIVQARTGASTADVVAHLALPGLAAVVVGWFAYRHRHPTRLAITGASAQTEAARDAGPWVGGAVVAGLLAAFTAGAAAGVPPWAAVLVADVVLVARTRWVPWRSVPIGTAIGVAALAGVVAVVVPTHALDPVLAGHTAPAIAGVTLLGAATANVANNLPAVLLAFPADASLTDARWGWLLGANAGAALLPIGALANLLWRRVLAEEGHAVSWRRYAALVVPIVLPALLAATVVHAVLA